MFHFYANIKQYLELDLCMKYSKENQFYSFLEKKIISQIRISHKYNSSDKGGGVLIFLA